MDALIVYPENEDQLAALKAVMKAMRVTFEQKSDVMPEYLIIGVRGSLKQAEQDRTTPYTGIKEMIGLNEP